MQLNDILTAAEFIKARLLETYGYDEAVWGEVRIKEAGEIVYRIFLKDHFQDNFESDSVQVGYQTFDFSKISLAFLTPDGFKTREERELHYMARNMGKAVELAGQFKSAAGRAFALKMSADIAELRTMIAGPK
ncbi:MAG TPA: hypothetical protein VK181_11855 [Rhizobium sp.]|nr:hypothetical protein [Rhizobium sp.]